MTFAPSKSRSPIRVFKMKRAKANCRIMPQMTVRHGNNFRLQESAQVHARITTIPSALINFSGIQRARVGEPAPMTRRHYADVSFPPLRVRRNALGKLRLLHIVSRLQFMKSHTPCPVRARGG